MQTFCLLVLGGLVVIATGILFSRYARVSDEDDEILVHTATGARIFSHVAWVIGTIALFAGVIGLILSALGIAWP